jgi:hypothetical protein
LNAPAQAAERRLEEGAPRTRRETRPIPPRPTSISTQAPGSGTEATEIFASRNCISEEDTLPTSTNMSGTVTNWYPPTTKVVEGIDSASPAAVLLIVATKGIFTDLAVVLL